MRSSIQLTIILCSATALLLTSGVAYAANTTFERTICDANNDNKLEYCSGETHVTHDPAGIAGTNRDITRTPLLPPLAVLGDPQVVDEESTGRCEPDDDTFSIGGISGCYRPQDSLSPHLLAAAAQGVNIAGSPTTPARFTGRRIAATLNVGDEADSAQYNETNLYIDILNGGNVDPDSGDPNYDPDGSGTKCVAGPSGNYPTKKYQGMKGAGEYYNPNGGNDGPGYSDSEIDNVNNVGRHVSLPDFGTMGVKGLFEFANDPFYSVGLNSPWLTAFGNHDLHQQGNYTPSLWPPPWPLSGQEATDCEKDGSSFTNEIVQPDYKRRVIGHQGWIAEHLAGGNNQIERHGFDPNNPDRGYYSVVYNGWRFIALDTPNRDGLHEGIIRDGSNGRPNQFGWLESQLNVANNDGEKVIIFGHHSLQKMRNTDWVGFEDQHCGMINQPGTSLGFSCSLLKGWPYYNDPLEKLLYQYPDVVKLYIAGHDHNPSVTRFKENGGSGEFWQAVVPSIMDWPNQGGMVEIFENNDQNDTISIFFTGIDIAAHPKVFATQNTTTAMKLASAGRRIAFNDFQGNNGEDGTNDARGDSTERNVELVLPK